MLIALIALLFKNGKTCAFHIGEISCQRRFYNNKGILNEYRRPKLAYYAVREAYRAFEQEEAQK